MDDQLQQSVLFCLEIVAILRFLLLFYSIFTDLEFVKKFTRPNFRAKEFYTLKTRKLRLFLPAINSKNASLSVIWSKLNKMCKFFKFVAAVATNFKSVCGLEC